MIINLFKKKQLIREQRSNLSRGKRKKEQEKKMKIRCCAGKPRENYYFRVYYLRVL